MRIDASIYRALDDGALTLDQMLATFEQAFDAIERTALVDATAEAVAAGFADADVKVLIEEQAHRLRERRPARLETIKQMLEARATGLQ